jgi:hypothetical protein
MAVAAVLAAGVTSASARGGNDDRKIVPGSCSDGSTSKLKAKSDDGRIEAEFEVDQNRTGVRWRVRMRHDGDVVARTRRTTTAPSGSFSIERRLPNHAGADRISARAVSPSGEVCRASLSF